MVTTATPQPHIRPGGVRYRWRQLKLIARYTARQLHSSRKHQAHSFAELYNRAWFSVGDKKLPTISLEGLFPGITTFPVTLEHAIPWVPGNLTTDELCIMALLRRYLQPRAIFEFGTFNGRTTLNLALNAPPDATVHTLDLPTPGETVLPTAWDDGQFQLGKAAGSLWTASRCRARIEQLWGDSAYFDQSPYQDRMDLIFIDAAHSYEYVANDTTKAFRMLKPGGIIVWDDYCAWYPGVTDISTNSSSGIRSGISKERISQS
jgi:predicted O-methyltransferase YrrM